MIGATIIGNLLLADTTLLATVPADQIKEGAFPENVDLPTILCREISSVDRDTLKRDPLVRVTDRVAVTVRASSYREMKQLVRRVRAICAGKTGDIGGGIAVSIFTAGRGPPLDDVAGVFEQTQDFRVSHETADA